MHTLAAALALLMFFYPFHNWVAGMCCFLLVAAILFLANLVMTDTDNPFKGVYNVSPEAFSVLAVDIRVQPESQSLTRRCDPAHEPGGELRMLRCVDLNRIFPRERSNHKFSNAAAEIHFVFDALNWRPRVVPR